MKARNKLLFAVVAADLAITALVFGLGFLFGARHGYNKGYERGAVFMLQQDVAALKACHSACHEK